MMGTSGKAGRGAPASATIVGRLASGRGEGASFTRLPWARAQFVAKLGIDPYPGTINLTLDDGARAAWAMRRRELAVVIAAPDAAFCDARAARVRIAGAIDGAVVVPLVAGYPDDKVEVIAAVGVRAALGLADGDPVELRFET